MFVYIDERYACELRDAHDFKKFALVVDHPASARNAVFATLAGIGGALVDQHAWIPTGWLQNQPGLAEDTGWQRQLQGMLAFANRKGWVDGTRGWVRAHIEWRETSEPTGH